MERILCILISYLTLQNRFDCFSCFSLFSLLSPGLPQAAGYTGKVKIGMDVAASEFLTEDKKYDLDFKNKGEKHDETAVKTG